MLHPICHGYAAARARPSHGDGGPSATSRLCGSPVIVHEGHGERSSVGRRSRNMVFLRHALSRARNDWGPPHKTAFSLGFRRALAIVDIRRPGASPMATEDGSVVIVFKNGATIYNFAGPPVRFFSRRRGPLRSRSRPTEVHSAPIRPPLVRKPGRNAPCANVAFCRFMNRTRPHALSF